MKDKKALIIIIIVIVLLLASAYLLYSGLSGKYENQQLSGEEQADETSQENHTSNKAPDFTVYDENGGEVKLSDYFGKPIVLNFWASWCGPCVSEMPEFNKKHLEFEDEVVFLMVNNTDGQRETVDSARDYVLGEGFSFKVLYDTDSDASDTYGVYALPTTYFIDENGVITASAKGALDSETLQRGIDLIK